MDISIRTAQHVNIVYQPAGLVNRIGATLIDLAFLGGIYILCFTLASLSSIFQEHHDSHYLIGHFNVLPFCL